MSVERVHAAGCRSDGLDWWCGPECPMQRIRVLEAALRELTAAVDVEREAYAAFERATSGAHGPDDAADAWLTLLGACDRADAATSAALETAKKVIS